jgi:hypothetical protein
MSIELKLLSVAGQGNQIIQRSGRLLRSDLIPNHKSALIFPLFDIHGNL